MSAPMVVPNHAYGTIAKPMIAQKMVGAPRNLSASVICQYAMMVAAGISMSAPTMSPNHTILISSAFAMPPPTNPAMNGLMGIATKCTAGIGMAINMIAKAVITPLSIFGWYGGWSFLVGMGVGIWCAVVGCWLIN